MGHSTILYISDHASSSSSVMAVLKETGCEIVSTDSPSQGVALLYIMRSVSAVVLDSGAAEHAGFDLTQSLRRIRPNVPVMLQCDDQIDNSPSRTESCVKTNRLAFELGHLLTAEAVV